MNKGSYGIAAFYLSLITSSEKLYGLPAHYQLAGELKETGGCGYLVACDYRLQCIYSILQQRGVAVNTLNIRYMQLYVYTQSHSY